VEVEVVTPEGTIWEGSATSVSVPSVSGSMSIRTGHEPVAAVLGAGRVQVRPHDDVALVFDITGGFVVVDSDDVTVLVDALVAPIP
jgi:F-type H+-transporting ATPase subunit epsilon